jgi:release factor glutamine methyltransferase
LRIKDIAGQSAKVGGLDVMNILSFALSMRKEEILINGDKEIESEKARHIETLLRERSEGKPLAYITGEKEFFSHAFHVDPRVLIPRPDTETIVEEALALLQQTPHMDAILDMGTGSGAIGNTIARITGKDVVCVDVSRDALFVAKKNGRTAGVSERLKFVCSDLFNGIKPGRRFDLIVANLPYVADEEWESLMIDVRDYEPPLALLGGKDGLDIYRKFVAHLPAYLDRKRGHVLCEIGGAEQAGEMVRIFEALGLKAAIKPDLAGRERVITGSWINLS